AASVRSHSADRGMTISRAPRACSSSTTCDPKKPLPPVVRIFALRKGNIRINRRGVVSEANLEAQVYGEPEPCEGSTVNLRRAARNVAREHGAGFHKVVGCGVMPQSSPLIPGYNAAVRVLVLGVHGQVGSELMALLPTFASVVGLARPDVDLE